MVKEKNFKQLCEENRITYANALYQRKKHPSLSNMEIIELCFKDKKDMTQEELDRFYTDKTMPFRIRCITLNIDFSRAYMFKSRHKDWSDDEIIFYYLNKELKKLCAINKLDYKAALLLRENDNTLTNDAIIKTLKEQ